MAKKKILIVDGHPIKKSLCDSLGDRYYEVAKKEHNVKIVKIRDLKFDPNLNNLAKEQPKVIKDQQKLFKWADHVVLITPLWWGSVPALLKGYMDRVLEKKVFYYYKKGGIPVGMMKGKTARFIYTQGAPSFYTYIFLLDSFWRIIKKGVFEFCGFKVKRTCFALITYPKEARIKKIFKKIDRLAKKGI